MPPAMSSDPMPSAAPRPTRRRLLAAAAGLPSLLSAAALAAADAKAGGDAAGDVEGRAPRARDVGRKFNADGSPMTFEGNTIVGHLRPQGPDYETFDAWLDIARELPRHGFARKLTQTPSSSWHVTLFGGVNDVDRGTPAWPRGLARDLPIAEVNRLMLQRLERLDRPATGPCAFVVDTRTPATLRHDGTLGIPLRPADPATDRRLAEARDAYADLFQLRRPDHEAYRYHVTIGYFVRVLDEVEAIALRDATADWCRRLAARGPLLIPAFHYCTLRDMFAFRELRPA